MRNAISLIVAFAIALWFISGFAVGAGWRIDSITLNLFIFGAFLLGTLGWIGGVLTQIRDRLAVRVSD
jgi:hypothetical protein